jgi:CRISPR/Cas system-associated protein endoribonuclease Cas2
MRIIDFLAEFPDELTCKLHFKNQREIQGVVCGKCSCTKHYWLQSKWQWQCSSCDFRTGLRSGTIMHKTKINFQLFYLCIAFMSATKKGISACEMQKQLGHKRYTTIWTLMHRIRNAMGQRDDRYMLDGSVEFDEGYFMHAVSENTKLKRGRGSQQKQNVAVAAESTPLEDIETGEQSSHFRYAKMKVLESHNAKELNKVVQENIEKKSVLITDKSTSYEDFSKLFDSHNVYKSTAEVTKTTLRWVHVTISNAKRNLLGVYHSMHKNYLQNYLNEFCYRLNRRYFKEKIFDRLVIATIYADK